ncbi:uncharacterized protein BJ212DRAFT_1341401 [Suillus subaureus]|uniref:Secreted protein n=1 Tax=Suillus subaureus TaxID=48587 RepID=A0A9P7JFJ5_9AGAM|nr:uncharacterized protein BJ212DRAFT_1341401 [Suillus subaureus]KAG1819520.1 hypothetical protein BJ212DRAFT_1341401 [Suillus subaureus]
MCQPPIRLFLACFVSIKLCICSNMFSHRFSTHSTIVLPFFLVCRCVRCLSSRKHRSSVTGQKSVAGSNAAQQPFSFYHALNIHS